MMVILQTLKSSFDDNPRLICWWPRIASHMATIVEDAISAWNREGLSYVIKNAPGHLIRKYGSNPYSLFEYFALSREDLVSHCKKQGQIWYYDSGTQFEMSPPLNKEVPAEYEDLIGTRSIGPNFVCEVSNAKLVGPYAIPISPNEKIIKETFGTSRMFQSRLRRTFQELGKTKSLKLLLNTPTTDQNSTHYGTVAHLVVRHGPNYDNPNYGHWINENLPQLQAIEHYEESTGENVKLLINRAPPSWLRDILEYMGYSSDDWIVLFTNAPHIFLKTNFRIPTSFVLDLCGVRAIVFN